jgi:hypothetical protein
MGVWQLGTSGLYHDRTDKGLKANYDNLLPGWTNDDVIGSPYAISAYTVNTELGTEADLVNLRQRLNALGLKLMLDYVPNHSAADAPEVTTNLSFYVRCPPEESPDPGKYFSNGIAYGCGAWCDPWTDVAQFNYMDQNFRASRIAVLKKIASLADGIRCDMAHLIINNAFWDYWKTQLLAWNYTESNTEFWSDAISAVKTEYPECIFMAESYGDVLGTLHSFGFDFTYDKDPLDHLRDGNVNEFKSKIWNRDISFARRMAHFTENHDEPRSVANFKGNKKVANSAALALLTLPGLRFVNQDQWNGYANKIDVHLRRAVKEDVDTNVISFYEALWGLLKRSELRSGDFSFPEFGSCDGFLFWKWSVNASRVLVAINFGSGQGSCRVRCPDAPGGGDDTVHVLELLTGVRYERSAGEMKDPGLYVELQGYSQQVFQY